MESKKAMAMEATLGLILVVIVFIVFFRPFTSEAGDYISNSGDSAACSLSLFQGRSTARCPVGDVNILSDKVEINGKKSLDRGNRGSQDMAKEALARLLAKCLANGGGYNSRAFSADEWFGTQSVCLECFNVKIDNKVGQVQGLTDYLRDTKAIGIRSDKTYLEVLTKDPSHLKGYMEYGAAFRLSPSSSTLVFKSGQDYTVFFIGLKHGWLTRNAKNVLDLSQGAVLELLFNTQDTYYSYITESSNIENVCDRKVN